MAKKKRKSKKKKILQLKERNQYKLAEARREIDLRTKSESLKKKKYTRKEKHKKDFD